MKELFPIEHARQSHEDAMKQREKPAWVRSGREDCRPFHEWRRKPYAKDHIPPAVDTRKKYARTSIPVNVYDDDNEDTRADGLPPVVESREWKDGSVDAPAVPALAAEANNVPPEIPPKSPNRKMKLKLRFRRPGNTLKACQ